MFAKHIGQSDGIKLSLQGFRHFPPDDVSAALMTLLAALTILNAALRQPDTSIHQANNAAQRDVLRHAGQIVTAHCSAYAFHKAGRLEGADNFFQKFNWNSSMFR